MEVLALVIQGVAVDINAFHLLNHYRVKWTKGNSTAADVTFRLDFQTLI